MSRIIGDLLRFISIAAVLIIHASSGGEREFFGTGDFFSEAFLAVLLNQWARFSVPLFILLSGYGLALKYQKEFTPGEFVQNRASKILTPFVVWTLFFLYLQDALFSGAAWTRAIFYGADYHFYFFTIIIQCYALFALLRKINSFPFLVLLFCLTLIFYSPSHVILTWLGLPVPAWPASLVVFWLFYFYAGIIFAYRQKIILERINRIPTVFFMAAAFLSYGILMYEYLAWAKYLTGVQGALPDWFDHFNRWSVILYTFALLAFIIRMGSVIENFLEDKPWLKSGVATGSALSFTVFIFHTNILRALTQVGMGNFYVALCVCLIPLSFTLAYLLHVIIPGPGILRMALGLPGKTNAK